MTTTTATPPALRTILVATDGSADAALAGRIAADLAGRSGAALHLAHAWLPPTGATADAPQPQRAVAEAVLADAAEALAALGAGPVATHLRQGPPAAALAALGVELDADLIVVGSRGHGPLRRLVLGSVSAGLAHEATRPVLVARGEQGWPPQRVVVGDDGTPAARQPAELAATLARHYGAPLLLVHACRPAPRRAARDGEEIFRRTAGMAPALDERAATLRDEVVQRATGVLSARAVALRAAGLVDVAPEVVVDEPAAAIVGAAEAAAAPALIVVGSRGLGALARLRLGSVSTKVLHAATGPVLVVPQH